MKRIIAMILLCGVMLTCFSGCEDILDYIWPQNTTVPPADDAALINALIAHLEMIDADLEWIVFSYGNKIDQIKSGAQAVHVAFNEANSYFMCGYFDCSHDDEKRNYRCVRSYEWVKYESADEIQENYNSKKHIVSFQINNALFIKDIISKRAKLPRVEYYQMYVPEFENGINIEKPIEFEETFIYLNRTKDVNVYCSSEHRTHFNSIFPCIYINGKYYLKLEAGRSKDGCFQTAMLDRDLGKYYISVEGIMEKEQYIVSDEETVYYYRLVAVDEFVREIFEN